MTTPTTPAAAGAAAGRGRCRRPRAGRAPARSARDEGALVVVQGAVALAVLGLALVVFRLGVAADLRSRAHVSADAATLAGAVATRDVLLAQFVAVGARTGDWRALGGAGAGCPAAVAYALRNSHATLTSCGYLPGSTLFTAAVLTPPTRDVGAARAHGAATLGPPSCRARYWTTGHTHFVTRTCTGNGSVAAMTWNLHTQTATAPPDIRAWQGLFHIRLVDEGTCTPTRPEEAASPCHS